MISGGKTGVFDIEDLVEVLKRDNAERIFVAKVPKEWAYVDYIVVVTAKSVRHMKALMQFVRKAYKIKRHETDLIPVTEGKTSSEWQAIDLGKQNNNSNTYLLLQKQKIHIYI